MVLRIYGKSYQHESHGKITASRWKSLPGHRGWRGVVHVLRLEDELHSQGHVEPVPVSESQDLVLVQDRVQVLYPVGVDGAYNEKNLRLDRRLYIQVSKPYTSKLSKEFDTNIRKYYTNLPFNSFNVSKKKYRNDLNCQEKIFTKTIVVIVIVVCHRFPILTVKHQPKSVRLLVLHSLPPQRGEDPVRPVVGGGVRLAEHLAVRDGLRIKKYFIS